MLCRFKTLLLWGAIFGGLFIISLYEYLLFHVFSEMFSIIVAVGIFMLIWNSRQFIDSQCLVFLGIGYLYVALLDIMHTLCYQGMPLLNLTSSNLATQLWVTSRFIEALVLLICPLLCKRKTPLMFFWVVFTTVVAIFCWLIFTDRFPACYIEHTGLTTFKIVSEYIICIILIGAIFSLRHHKAHFDPYVLNLLTASMIITIAAELSFTLYTDVYGLMNQIGHFLKLISFYLIYKAVIQVGITEPYTIMLRNLEQSKNMLKIARDKAQNYIDVVDVILLVIEHDQTVSLINRKGCQILGHTKHEIIGENWFDKFVPVEEKQRAISYFNDIVNGKSEPEEYFESSVITASGQRRTIGWQYAVLTDDTQKITAILSSGEDITERKQVQANLNQYRRHLEELVDARTVELTKANELLKREITERKQLEMDILNISDRQQRIIGQELHDSIGQQFAGLAMMISVLQKKLEKIYPSEAQYARKIARYINQTVNQARRLAKGLSPVVLDSAGLMSALEELAASTQGFGVSCQFICDKPILLDDNQVAIHVYRIAQEAIANGLKHGQAGNIIINLSQNNSNAILTVNNDGKNFPDHLPQDKGMGLRIMHYRAEMINATITISKRQNGGTVVKCVFPCALMNSKKENITGKEKND